MDNIEYYDIHMSLSEGLVRDMFPKITALVHSYTNKKNLMLALDDYVKRVSKGIPATGSLVMTVAGIYRDVNNRELEKIIEKLVKMGKLPREFDPVNEF